MGETDKPSQGMLNFIRELLSQHMSAKRAKNLSDNEISWIAPLVQHELDKLDTRSRDIVILRYGLYGRKPLSYAKVGIQVGEGKPLTRERVRQITARVVRALSYEIRTLTNDEFNLCLLLSGGKDATPVLKHSYAPPTSDDLECIINDLKIIQYKYNVMRLIYPLQI